MYGNTHNGNSVSIEDGRGNIASFENIPEEYPEEAKKIKPLVTLTAQEFLNLFELVSFSALDSREEKTLPALSLRPAFKGCLVIFEQSKITAVATNAYRLAINSIDVDTESLDGVKTLISARAINIALKLLKKGKASEEVTLWLCDNEHVAIEFGNIEVTGRIIPDQFPPLANAIPTPEELTYSISFYRDQALQALKKTCTDKYRDFVTLDPQPDYLVLKTKKSTFKIPATSDALYPVTFRMRYLIDILERIKTDYVTIKLGCNRYLGRDVYHAAVIEHGRFKYVVMPIN